jgi:hypothetical protein
MPGLSNDQELCELARGITEVADLLAELLGRLDAPPVQDGRGVTFARNLMVAVETGRREGPFAGPPPPKVSKPWPTTPPPELDKDGNPVRRRLRDSAWGKGMDLLTGGGS